jgi:hypothetical protein
MKTSVNTAVLKSPDSSRGVVISCNEHLFIYIIVKTYRVDYSSIESGLFEFLSGQALVLSQEGVAPNEPSIYCR